MWLFGIWMAGREKLTTNFHVMLTISYSLDPNSINILQPGIWQWEDNLRPSETEKKKHKAKQKPFPISRAYHLLVKISSSDLWFSCEKEKLSIEHYRGTCTALPSAVCPLPEVIVCCHFYRENTKN